MMRRVIIFLLLAPALFGQISSGYPSVTVSATLDQNVQADQVAFSVTLESGANTTLDDVIGALQGTGLTKANFSNVYSTQLYNNENQPYMVLDWTFSLAVPLTSLKSEATALTALQVNLGKAANPLTLSYSVQGPQASAQAQSCSLPSLVSAARTKAQQIASAANLNVGILLALSSNIVTLVGPTTATTSVTIPCSLMVKFSLGGF